MSDFKDDLQIDKYSLDEEWERQPQLFLKYAEDQAEYETRRDRLKDLIEVEKAEIEKDIREFPSNYNLEKVTNDSVRAIIVTDEKIKEMQKEYFSFFKTAKVYGALTKSLDHKKKALEKLTELHLSGYYSKPTINGEFTKKKDKNIKKEQNESLKRNWRRKR